MARLFRLYEKKRGDRRTGSKKLGSLGEALFFVAFLCVGCGALATMLSTLIIPEWRANRHYVEATCTVLEKRVGKTERDGLTTYRPEIHIRYLADGYHYEDTTYDATEVYFNDRAKAEAAIAEFDVGKEYPCWYDPMNPSEVVVVRGYSGWMVLLLLIPISFVAIGGGGLLYTMLHWNTSDERRAAISQRAAKIDLFEADPGSHRFPSVPGDANLTNSPGTRLAYRLPIVSAPGWKLFAALTACVLWNGVVSIFVVMAISSHVRGEPDWLLTAFITPFVLAGLGLIVYLIRQLLMTTGVGATRVEISHHPLFPGQEYDIFVAQAGRLTMNRLQVSLVCTEKATYRQGTDTRTDRRRVFEECVLDRGTFEIHQGMPFESQCRVTVPATAMHSFKADHNEINWTLVVAGTVEGWPNYERVFPVVVCPELRPLAQRGGPA